MVDAAAAELIVPTDIMTDEDKLASFYVLELFVAHYARQPEGRTPHACTYMYDQIIARMKSNAGISAADALVCVVGYWTAVVYIAVMAVMVS